MNTVTACAGWVSVGKCSPEKLNAHQSLSRRMFKMKLSHSCCKWWAGVEWEDLFLPAAPALWILWIFLEHLRVEEKRRRGKKLLYFPGIIFLTITGTWAFPHCFCARPFLLLAFPHCCSHHDILLEPLNLNGFTGNPSSSPFRLP